MNLKPLVATFQREGYVIAPDILSSEVIFELKNVLHKITSETPPGKKKGGIRGILRSSAIQELIQSPEIRSLIFPLLGSSALAVRGTLFNKTTESNWLVPWHQDLTISVKKRLEVNGYSGWTFKENIHYVQPPVEIMQNMLSIRLHLDPTPIKNGALRVIPSTHTLGRFSSHQIDHIVQTKTPVYCEANAGDAILMHPFLLHSSSAIMDHSFKHRRVIHIEFSNSSLPQEMEWALA